MLFRFLLKRVFWAGVLVVVAGWCFDKVRMPFSGEVPWSVGNIIWVIVLAIVGLLTFVWALRQIISIMRVFLMHDYRDI